MWTLDALIQKDCASHCWLSCALLVELRLGCYSRLNIKHMWKCCVHAKDVDELVGSWTFLIHEDEMKSLSFSSLTSSRCGIICKACKGDVSRFSTTQEEEV